VAGYSSGVCGRFTLSKSAAEIAAQFDLHGTLELVPRFNVAPRQEIAVIVPTSGGGQGLEMRQWGLLPGFALRPDEGHRPINARIESVEEKKSFRGALRERRCLVLADGFFEWKEEGGRKLPHFMSLPEGDLFAMAGLHEDWESPEGEVLRTVVILTTQAEGPVQAIHDRMPVMLSDAQQQQWLDANWDGAGVTQRIRPSLALDLRTRPVGKRVNNVRNDDPGCLELDPLPLFDR